MALSRLRSLQAVLRPKIELLTKVPNAKSSSTVGWNYRRPAVAPKSRVYAAEGIMTLMWYWILFHCWYQSEHIFGHFPYPDPSKWTDAELGIPPDSED